MRNHAMKSLHINPADNGKLLRLALVAIALYATLPAQLVWCHGEGRSPRMEAGFNGQCLAVAVSDCCHDGRSHLNLHSDGQAESVGAGGHHQCIGCSDQPAHHQQSADAAVQQGAKRVAPGGFLFSLAAAQLSGTARVARSSRSINPERIPGLPVLHARTTCLLI